MTENSSRSKNCPDDLQIDNVEEEKTLKEVLKDLADSSSLHGVPKIVSSRQIAVKVLWCLLFVATSSVLVFQLTRLFRTFYSHPIQTTVSLGYSSIKFPAISICNMNPIRSTKLHLSEPLKRLMEEEIDSMYSSTQRKKRSTKAEMKDFEETQNKIEETKEVVKLNNHHLNRRMEKGKIINPSSVQNTDEQTKTINTFGHIKNENKKAADFNNKLAELSPSPSLMMKGVRRRKREAADSETGSYASTLTTSVFSSPTSILPSQTSSSMSSYYYDYWYDPWLTWYNNYDGFDYWNDGSGSFYDDQWYDIVDPDVYIQNQLNSNKDTWDVRAEKFRTYFKNESVENRWIMGHQKEDLIMSASFAGSIKNVTKFKNFTSPEYGNCYTMSSPLFVAWRNGPSHGIKLTLNVEVYEYIENFSNGYGVRLLMHEPGGHPLPTKEGITLGPGTETYIGLKMVRLSRLGPPYGNCIEGSEFSTQFRRKYTKAACNHFCRIKKTMDVCNCIPVDAPEEIQLNKTVLPICNSSVNSEKRCLLEIDSKFNNGEYSCDCHGPCRETIFERTMSSRYWPTSDYVDVLLSEVCEKNRTDMPETLKDTCTRIDILNVTEHEKFRNNFLRVLIYFEDLNFETITEEPLYESVRFLSDIGGAMGLFLGASVLSLVEVLQLLLEIVLFAWRKIRATKTTKVQVLK